MSWQNALKKKPIVEVEAEKVEEIAPIQGDELDKEMCKDVELPEMENPFSSSSEDISAVSVAAQTLDPNPDRLGMIANNRSPQAHAVCDSYADYEAAMGCEEIAQFDRALNRNLLKYGISREGKENRVTKVLEMLKAAYSFQQQEELSQGDKAFGRRK